MGPVSRVQSEKLKLKAELKIEADLELEKRKRWAKEQGLAIFKLLKELGKQQVFGGEDESQSMLNVFKNTHHEKEYLKHLAVPAVGSERRRLEVEAITEPQTWSTG